MGAPRLTRRILLFMLLVATPAWADTMHGRVVDPHNLPVAGVKVLVVRGDRIVATLTTDERGAYGPEPLAPGRYDVFVAAAGFRADPRSVTIGPGAIDHEVNITLIVSIASEYVVVTAAHMEQTLSRVTDASTVLDRSDLKALQTTSLAESLRLVPGIHVIASGSAGSQASVLPRGGEPDYTLVLVDGMPQNRFGGEFDAAHLNMQNVERIEVIRGPSSAVLGSQAIGALVHVVTRRREPFGLDGTMEGGGPEHGRAGVTTRGLRGPWSWNAAAEQLTHRNNTGRQTASGVRVTNDDYARTSAAAELEWQDPAGQLVRASVRGGRDERGYPGPWGSDPAGFNPGVDVSARGRNALVSAGITGLFRNANHFQHQFQLAWTSARTDFLNGALTASDRTRRTLAHYHMETEIRTSTTLTIGSDIEHEQADDTLIRSSAETPVPVKRLFSGWFGEVRQRIGQQAFITGGVRFQRIAREGVDAGGAAGHSRPAIPLSNVWGVTPKLSATWFVRPSNDDGWTRVRVGVGTGLKMPTALEVAFTETPELGPERTRTFDMSIEHSAFAHRLLLESTWFSNRYRDLIAAVLTPQDRRDRYALSSVSEAATSGVETAITWRTVSGVSALASVTWLRSEVRAIGNERPTATPFQVGDALIRRPRIQGTASVSVSRASGTMFLTVTGRSRMSDLEPNLGRQVFDNPRFLTVAGGASVSVRPRVEIFGRAENLFDRAYEETLGYPALGRTLTVGVNFSVR